jgi:hypothetical protein
MIIKKMWGTWWYQTINWGWIGHRWKQRHCQHVWVAGELKKNPKRSCNRVDCGVWRWNPLTWRIMGYKAPPRVASRP